LKILEQTLEIAHPIIPHGIIHINPLSRDVNHSTHPMHKAMIDGDEYLAKVKDILARSSLEPALDIFKVLLAML
jgi:hypothetical protein